MEKFQITFWCESYNHPDSFVKESKGFITSATVNKSINGDTTTYRVRVIDLGLFSEFGEFDIMRKNGKWETSDQDSPELNQLKHNIIHELDSLSK